MGLVHTTHINTPDVYIYKYIPQQWKIPHRKWGSRHIIKPNMYISQYMDRSQVPATYWDISHIGGFSQVVARIKQSIWGCGSASSVNVDGCRWMEKRRTENGRTEILDGMERREWTERNGT